MAGTVNFPSGGGSPKGKYSWERYIVLADDSKQFDCFVSSNNENAYPDGDVIGNYFYQKCYSESETVYVVASNADTAYAQLATQEVVPLTATEKDIRMGSVAVTEKGITEGSKDIPPYHTKQGTAVILPNEELKLQFYTDIYDYTGFQASIAKFNTEVKDSVDVEMTVINGYLYKVGSTEPVSAVVKDGENKNINLGIVNGDSKCVIRYILFKEEY